MLSSSPKALLKLREALQERRYSPTVVNNYCLYAGQFLSWLQARETELCDVTPDLVARYLDHAVRQFEKDRGRPPASRWPSIPRSGIHALLRSALTEWPPTPPAASTVEQHNRAVCAAYELWLSQERGLAEPSIKALMWEARHFCKWLFERTGKADFADLSVRDIDA